MTTAAHHPLIDHLSSQAWRARLLPHTFAEWASGGLWRAWPFWRHIGSRLGPAIVRGGARIAINLPPGTGKSTFLSQWLPTWFLENWPEKRVICATHTQTLADENGRIVRNNFESIDGLTTQLSEDSTAKAQWNTTARGGMKCVGVGVAVIGFRANLVLIDDPYGRWEDAYSNLYNRTLQSWFDASIQTRLEPNASIVVLHHRFATDDLTGWLSGRSGDKWEVVSLPALAGENDPMGRKPGESICEERFSRAELERRRDSTASVIWDAMYQQAPRMVGSGACYASFGPHNIDPALELDLSRPLQVSLDYNITPGMHAVIGQYLPDRDALTAVYDVHGPRMTIDQCLAAVKAIADRHGRFPEWEVFADPAGTAANAATTDSHHTIVKRWLTNNGIPYRWRVRGSHPPVLSRVHAFNDALLGADGKPHYFVHTRCKVLIEDLSKVKADEDGKPDKSDPHLTHASDAEGYRIDMVRPLRVAARREYDARFIYTPSA